LIPEDVINRIRERADIVDIVGAHLSLTKAGQNFKGLCPFHQEKTPSFTVSPSRQTFHCFGCGEGGNVFSFLMKIDGSTFPAVVRALGEKVGVPVEDRPVSPAVRQRMELRERLLALTKVAAERFHLNLLADAEAEPARNYLASRGMTPDTIERFDIGYSQSGWDGTLTALTKAGFSAEDIAAAGLAIPREQAAGFYDRFRGRVMFPIRDLQKQVIGFGGRMLDDGTPKYLNSPETPLFSKGRILYALDAARDAITRLGYVIVVEGYFDAIALHQAGCANAVATLGTALTPEHLELIRRFTQRVVLLFDPDSAGVRAALRTMDLFLGSGFSVQVGSVPAGDDPDTFIRSQGPDAFAALIKSAPSLLEFTVQASLTAGRAGTVEDRVRCVEDVLTLLQKLSNPVEQSAAIRHVADQLGMDEKALLARYKALPRKSVKASTPQPSAGVFENQPLPKDEEVLLQLLVHEVLTPEMWTEVRAEDFTDTRAKRLVSLVCVADAPHTRQQALAQAGEDELCGSITRALSMTELPYDNINAAFQQSLKALKLRRIAVELQEIKAAEALATKAGRDEEARTLLVRLNVLQQERQKLSKINPSSYNEAGRIHA